MSLSRQSSTRSRSRPVSFVGGSTGPAASPSAVKVVARFRPSPGESCVEEWSDQHVRLGGQPQPFVFDAVLGPATPQADVFDNHVRQIVDSVLAGFNGCVLAYGQTGAGKSHTMMGSAGSQRGVIPRIVEHVFANKRPDVVVSVSYLEIYNEKVRDLLADQPGPLNTTPNGSTTSTTNSTTSATTNGINGTSGTNGTPTANTNSPLPNTPKTPAINSADLKVHEHAGGGGFYVKGLRAIPVSHTNAVFQLMAAGNRVRSTAATLMNQASSRSHSVFLVEVIGPVTRSKLVLVDLAGSEKVAKTGARGVLLEEAGSINKSLTSLGMVINALAAAGEADASDSRPASATAASAATAPSAATAAPGAAPGAAPPPPTPAVPPAASGAAPTAPSSASSSGTSLQSAFSLPTTGERHIPYRDSKLTRILQDSLAGNSRICLILHCSPAAAHASETVSTLRFGLRAKCVQTQAAVNLVAAPNTTGELLKTHQQLHAHLTAENSRLQRELEGSRRRSGAQQQCLAGLQAELAALEAACQDQEMYLYRAVPAVERSLNQQP